MSQRKRTRVQTQFQVLIRTANKEFQLQSRDISLKGLLCTPEPRLVPGEECRILLQPDESLSLEIQGQVIRSDYRGLAVDFNKLSPQSFFHLRNLIRLHANDPDAIDQELASPAFGQDKKS